MSDAVPDEIPAPPSQHPAVLDKETVLLAFDSAIASLMGMRQLIDVVVPDGFQIVIPEPGACPHKNRAPSMPSFCLDCEQEVAPA